jgi:hypothetical protein
MITGAAWRAVSALMIHFAKRMDLLARDENPRGGRRHIHDRVPLLFGRLSGYLDPKHQADLSMKSHADGLFAASEVHGAEGGHIESNFNHIVPITVHLIIDI